MKLRKNKKPSFSPRKKKLSLKEKLEWLIIVITLLDTIGISVKEFIQGIVEYITSKL